MMKQRLDMILVERGLATSREKAKACIMAGIVLVNEQKIDKAGTMVSPEAKITIIGNHNRYVSRGGLKLEKAIQSFNIKLDGKKMIDIGASTGGFTDCALQHGASRVYAIDVGYGQLAWSLRTDERVVNMERTNIRNIGPQDIGELVDFISIDVAFISLDKVLPTAKQLLSPSGCLVALIKPQFEAGRDKVGKKGVVKDPAIHIEVICKVVTIAHNLDLGVSGLTYSPIKGPEGNIEYLIFLIPQSIDDKFDLDSIRGIVQEAHESLSNHGKSGANCLEDSLC